MKNSLTKFRFMSRTLAVMLLFSASIPAFGQEMIREVGKKYPNDTSIIREVSENVSLIYLQDCSSTYFILHTNNNVSAPLIFLEDFVVKDFEVVGNQVYFCGCNYSEAGKKAAFGFFSLYSFPSYATTTYFFFDRCKEMRKIDVYETEYQMQWATHLVMTGTTDGSRSDVLLDVNISIPFGYNCTAYMSADKNENIDDVAVTDNKVFASVRREEYGFPVIEFWRFDKPTTPSPGLFIFSSGVNRFRMTSPVAETPVFLEHTTGDQFAAVSKVSSFPRMAMMKPNVTNNICNIVEIFGDTNWTLYPMDIKYNRQGLVYDILAREYFKIDPKYNPLMQIYHISQDVINNTVPYGLGTRYPQNHVWSIDPKNNSHQYQFIASGKYDIKLRFYQYYYYQWNGCPDYFEYSFDTGERKMVLDDSPLSPIYTYILKRNNLTPQIKTKDFIDVCREQKVPSKQ